MKQVISNLFESLSLIMAGILIAFITILAYNQYNDQPHVVSHREATDEYNRIYKPAYIRIRVLKTGTTSWCMSARGDIYQTGDRVKVNLFTHMIVDNDPLANSCILLDSYSPDDCNNQ